MNEQMLPLVCKFCGGTCLKFKKVYHKCYALRIKNRIHEKDKIMKRHDKKNKLAILHEKYSFDFYIKNSIKQAVFFSQIFK